MRDFLARTLIIARREFASYFATPLALVFLVIFAATTAAFAFYIGSFLDRGQADLTSFFLYHPWLYLLLVPAIAMRLWAEERKTGSVELLMTLPIRPWEAILGKFLAAWAFLGIALAATFPMWITVNYLGAPDNGVILTSYIGSFLVAGAFLAVGSCLSATTNNQVIAFVATAAVCFLLAASGMDLVLNAFRSWTPRPVVAAVQAMSILGYYDEFTKGIVGLPALVFFASLIGFFLFANKIVLDEQKSS